MVFGPCSDCGSSSPPGELFISHSPIWTICSFFSFLLADGPEAPKVGVSVSGSFHDTTSLRGEMLSQI